MEIALFLNDLKKYYGRKVCAYKQNIGTSEENGLQWANRLLCEHEIFANQEFTYLYFGNEFCEYRIPNSDQIREFLQICNRDNLLPVFVTPPVTDFGIEQIKVCLEQLSLFEGKVSVVVNDYGVMEFINRNNYKFDMVAGRVLDKLSHEARADVIQLQEYYGEEGGKYASIPGILSKSHRNMLRSYHINRYEFDYPKVGFCVENIKEGLSLYWPYNYETTGRVCMFRSLDRKGTEKFLVGGLCKGNCRNIVVERTCVSNTADKKYYLLQAGNTIFYINKEADFDRLTKTFDRLILQIL